MKVTLVLICLVLLAVNSHAAVKPHALVSNGGVLQHGIEVPVWGTANDGEEVTVKFHGPEISTVAMDGRWLVKLKPLKAGGPFTMPIAGLEITDLLVGEVWLCSGQSNMEWPLKKNHQFCLNFQHIGSGLLAKGGDRKGFTIVGAEKVFTNATAHSAGKQVIVSSPAVPQPVAVRYGWSNVPDVNLDNHEGLPASPFRTDLP